MALIYSQTALGLATGVFSLRDNLEEQSRTVLFVTRVPIAPLYPLIVLNLFYVVIGALMAFIALRANPLSEGVREVQTRLSVWGLVAYGFENPVTDRPVQKVEKRQGTVRNLDVVGVRKGIGENGWMFRTRQRT